MRVIQYLVSSLLAAILVATIFVQHPNPVFSRVRSFDQIGALLPNWRFFAPFPAMQDFHILHRLLNRNGEESKWAETYKVKERRLHHFLWFPNRRTDKAIFDIVAELNSKLPEGHNAIVNCGAYRILSAFVRGQIQKASLVTPIGYQFMIVSATGYDKKGDVSEVLISPYIEWIDNC